MKSTLSGLTTNSQYLRIYKWFKLITITGSSQAIVQGLGLVCGLLVIRLLPTTEYAWYTLANTMLGTMTLLADGGISTGVMAQGGKVWQDKEKLGAVLATGLDLRRKFAVVSLLVSSPILVYLLFRHGASWLTALLIIASLIPAFLAALSDSLFEIVPKLHQDINFLQKNQITVSTGRLLLSGLTLFIFPYTFVAILASGIPRIYGNIKLRSIANTFTGKDQQADKVIRKDILKVVKRILPGIIYYCFTGQITIFLISMFGSTVAVAEIGALGRIAMLVSIFSALFSTLVLPRFARLPDNYSLLLKRYIQILLGLFILGVCLTLATWVFSGLILSVLGRQYSGLHKELVLYVISSCLSLSIGVILSLYNNRGWTYNPIIGMVRHIASFIVAILLFDISSIIGIIKFNIFVVLIELITDFFYVFFRIRKLRNVNNDPADQKPTYKSIFRF